MRFVGYDPVETYWRISHCPEIHTIPSVNTKDSVRLIASRNPSLILALIRCFAFFWNNWKDYIVTAPQVLKICIDNPTISKYEVQVIAWSCLLSLRHHILNNTCCNNFEVLSPVHSSYRFKAKSRKRVEDLVEIVAHLEWIEQVISPLLNMAGDILKKFLNTRYPQLFYFSRFSDDTRWYDLGYDLKANGESYVGRNISFVR